MRLGSHRHALGARTIRRRPDMLTAAKPLAGGLPIGATLVTDAVAAVMKPGDHASTFAGGPLVCSAAQIVLNRVTKAAFLDQVRDNSAYLMAQLRKHLTGDDVVEIRGCGFLVGVEFANPVTDLITAAFERGLMFGLQMKVKAMMEVSGGDRT